MGFFKDIYEGRSWFYGDAIKRIKEDINLLYGIGVLLNKKPEISQFLTIEHSPKPARGKGRAFSNPSKHF